MPAFQKSVLTTHLWLFVTATGLFILLLSMLAYINTGSLSMMLKLAAIVREGTLIFAGILVAVYWVHFVTGLFDRLFEKNLLAGSRYIYEMLLVVAGGFAINFVFHLLFIWWVVVPEPDQAALRAKLNNLLVVNQTLIVIMYAIVAAFKSLKHLKEKENAVARVQKEMLHSQFEAIKNRLNPDFLFDSMNTLTALVHHDTVQAGVFIDRLSKTYRYLLDQRHKELVALDEEVGFLDNYSFLLHQRYGSRIALELQLETHGQLFLMPHTFLTIFEYIISRHKMSPAQPLKIQASVRGKFLLIVCEAMEKQGGLPQADKQWEKLKEAYARMGKPIQETRNDPAQESRFTIPLFAHYE